MLNEIFKRKSPLKVSFVLAAIQACYLSFQLRNYCACSPTVFCRYILRKTPQSKQPFKAQNFSSLLTHGEVSVDVVTEVKYLVSAPSHQSTQLRHVSLKWHKICLTTVITCTVSDSARDSSTRLYSMYSYGT